MLKIHSLITFFFDLSTVYVNQGSAVTLDPKLPRENLVDIAILLFKSIWRNQCRFFSAGLKCD